MYMSTGWTFQELIAPKSVAWGVQIKIRHQALSHSATEKIPLGLRVFRYLYFASDRGKDEAVVVLSGI